MRSGPVTRRDTISIMPATKAIAAAKRPRSSQSLNKTISCCFAVYSLAVSSAATATLSSEASLLADIFDHTSAGVAIFSPAISCFRVFNLSWVYSSPKNSRLASATALVKRSGTGSPEARSSRAAQAVSTVDTFIMYFVNASGGNGNPPSVLEITTEASPPPLRAIQASCFSSIN